MHLIFFYSSKMKYYGALIRAYDIFSVNDELGSCFMNDHNIFKSIIIDTSSK